MSLPQERGRWRMACATDVGRERVHQEDVALAVDEIDLMLVADGMGGHHSGIVAASTAAASIERALHLWSHEPWDQARAIESHPLPLAIALANAHIFERFHTGQHPSGQATTVVAAQRAGDRVVIAHVGNSRAYRLRGGRIERLTHDHTLLNDASMQARLAGLGVQEQEEVRQHFRNVVTRVLGHKVEVEIDARVEPLWAGDVYLLTSDGVYDELADEDMAAMLAEPGTLREVCRSLIEAANERGGRDNLAVAVARWEGA